MNDLTENDLVSELRDENTDKRKPLRKLIDNYGGTAMAVAASPLALADATKKLRTYNPATIRTIE